MPTKEKKNKNQKVVKNTKDNSCPQKEGDNCKAPGVYGDSDPIGGGG